MSDSYEGELELGLEGKDELGLEGKDELGLRPDIDIDEGLFSKFGCGLMKAGWGVDPVLG